jgi:hypothetical protein
MNIARRWYGIVLPIALLIGAAPVAAQSDSSTAGRTLVRGHVVTTDKAPLDEAIVTIFGLGAEAHSDSRGQFRFPEVPLGDYMIAVRRIGYAPSVFPISVVAGGDDDFEVELAASANRLEDLTVKGDRYAGLPTRFSEMARRLDQKQSTVFSSNQFSHYPTVQYALRMLLPLRFVASGSGRNCLDLSIENAYPRQTIRGSRGAWVFSGPNDLVPISVLSAIEYIPPENAQSVFPGRRSTCGLAVLWY